jgi:CHAT domain-containing protein/tetratricopeptide (TPR) repeat protein
MEFGPEQPRRTLTDGVETLSRLTVADQALALARQLLTQLDDNLPADAGTARDVNQLAVFFSNRAFNDEARRAATRALGLLSAAGERDDALLADIHNNLGQLDERNGDYAAAERHLETALALARGGGSPLQFAIIQDNLAAVLSRQGKYDRAEPLHREALETFASAGPKYLADVATVLGNLGLLYRKRGEAARAKAHLLRAIDTHLRVRPLETGDARIPLVNLIALLLEQGDEHTASQMTDMLLRIGGARISAAHHATAIALLELGSAAFDHFRLEAAERIADRACRLLEVTAGPVAPPTLRALRLLANVHAAKGDFESAEKALLRALNAPGVGTSTTAGLLIDFSKAVRQRGRSSAPTAVAFLERAIGLLRASDRPDKPALASALGNLAQVHFLDRDDSPRAEQLFNEALALGTPQELGGEYAWLLYSRGLLHYHLARHDEALEGMTQALRLWRRRHGDGHPFVATAHANLALVHWARGDLDRTQRHFTRAADAQSGEFVRLLLIGNERQRLTLARDYQGGLFKQVSLCFAAGARGAAARAAAQLLIQRKGSVLDALALTHGRLHDLKDLDGTTRARVDRLTELRRLISRQSLSEQLLGASAGAARDVASWQAEEQQLQSELSHAGALGAGVLDPVTLEDVRTALPAGAVLIEYVRWSVFDPVRTGHGIPWRGERYAAMVLRPRGEPLWFDLGDAAEIEAGCTTLRSLLSDPDSDPDTVRTASLRVYARLVAPFESLLAQAKQLIVAPDGELNILPFAVLGDPTLGDRAVVSHVASGRDLLRRASEVAAGGMVQVIVDPDFDAGPAGAPPAIAGLEYEALPGTRAEGDAIRALFPQAVVQFGADAAVAALGSGERPVLLHIATHGFFVTPPRSSRLPGHTDVLHLDDELLFFQRALPSADVNPMLYGGLALAGANRSAPGRLVGHITAAEVASLDLRGTELVVLSACATGLGVATHGEEFAGLRRAFAIAGAASQVISLWAVEDEATAMLMEEFYKALAAGAGRAEALWRAQQAVRRQPDFAHPSAWAAFVPWGAAGPLSEAVRGEARSS